MLDTVYNHTAKSISSALITVVVKGSPAIFSRLSASNFYLEMEQMSVIHFLDTAKFNSIVSLIRTNRAYNVSLSPATGRPEMTFTDVSSAWPNRYWCYTYHSRCCCYTYHVGCMLYAGDHAAVRSEFRDHLVQPLHQHIQQGSDPRICGPFFGDWHQHHFAHRDP